MATWKFVVTDLMHTPIGELTDYYEMTIGRRLNGTDSGSFRVRAGNPHFALLASQRCMVKGYRDGVLQANMYVWTAEVTGDTERVSLAVTLAAPGIRLRSLYLLAPSAVKLTASEDRYRVWGHLARRALDYRIKNPAPGGGSGAEIPMTPLRIPYADLGSPMLFDSTEDDAAAANMNDRFAVFSSGTAGFDWYWEPTEVQWAHADPMAFIPPIDPGGSGDSFWTTTDNFDIWNASTYAAIPDGRRILRSVATLRAATSIGTDRTSDAVFEYGTGLFNLAGFSLTATREYQATYVAQLGPVLGGSFYEGGGGGDAAQIWGNIAVVDPFQEGDDPVYRQALLNEAVALRKNPMRRLSITPATMLGNDTDPPDFGPDFALGDTVTARVVDPATGTYLVDGIVRVHGVSWTVKESGAETMSVTIQEEG